MPAIEKHRIAGTRITVWDVLHHVENNWSVSQIAEVFNLTVDQIEAAIDYIDKHRNEVMEVHRRIEERNAHGNPPEIDAKAAQARSKRLDWLQQRQDTHSKEQDRVGDRT